MIKAEQYIIGSNKQIRDALTKINDFSMGQSLVLFVINEIEQILGSITDGDIRRGLLKGLKLEDSVQLVMNTDYHFLKSNFTLNDIKKLREKLIDIVPLVDENNKIVKFINFKRIKSILPLDVVIMAGGKGKRLKPLTDEVPKPLLKIGDKTIIEHNIDRLTKYGINNFFVAVNHFKEQIIDYLKNKQNVEINYTEEPFAMGTIGAVSLIKEFKNENVLILNADLLTNMDFEDFYEQFIEENADLSVASIPYDIDVPYAVLETNDNEIKSFAEKPTYTYHSNGGIYLVKKELLKLIPQKKFDAIEFMQLLIDKNYKVTYFPILDYWLDIGNDTNYRKALVDIKHLRL
jgi:dTDP-glucose pyrophosphorylase